MSNYCIYCDEEFEGESEYWHGAIYVVMKREESGGNTYVKFEGLENVDMDSICPKCGKEIEEGTELPNKENIIETLKRI